MQASNKHTVAIVGYGPVGAALGNLLAQRGIDVAVVEEHHSVYPTPRAGGLVPESLRLLQVMGIADELVKDMQEFTFWYDIFDKDWNLIAARDPDMGPALQGWANNHTFLQPKLEAAVRRENSKLGVHEYTGYRASMLSQDETGADLTLTSLDAEKEDTSIRADWVIGADGSRSQTRTAIGSEIEDFGGDESWLLVHLRVTDESANLPDRIFQWAHPDRAVSYITPLPDNIKLFEFRVMPGDTVEDLTSTERVWELLSPWLKQGQAELIRTVVYQFHSRLATGWRNGRVLLAGDAAHTMPPDLAEGLNSGLRDVINIAWKLQGVIEGALDESILDTYEIERRPHVRAFTVMSLALATATANIADDPDSFRTTLALDSVFRHPFPLVGPGVHGETPPPVGLMAEQPTLADGTRMDDAIGYHFAIIGDLSHDDHSALDDELWAGLQTKYLAGDDPAIRDWLDRLGTKVVVLRPDRLILGVANTPDELNQIGERIKRFVRTGSLTRDR
jgi:3-(3-hydroxy-phenyl)propionate hydroxylase